MKLLRWERRIDRRLRGDRGNAPEVIGDESFTEPGVPRLSMRWAAGWCLALALLGACGADPVTPEATLHSSYALVRFDVAYLPVRLFTEGDVAHWLVEESLSFDGRDGVTRRSVIRRVNVRTGEEVVERLELEQAYSVDGRTVEIAWREPCPPNANCIGPESGTLSGRALAVRSRLYSGHRLTYLQQ